MEKSPFISSILVVQSDRARAIEIISFLRTTYPDDKIRHAMDLTEAYNLSETVQPDLVVLEEKQAQLSGFPMFLSLLSALAIDWVVVTRKGRLDRIPDRRQTPDSELQRFLKYEWGPRAALRHQLIKRPPASAAPATARPTKPRARVAAVSGSPATVQAPSNTVVIGASTGGIEGLIEILSGYPANGPPTLIVQHINPAFLPGLADRLDRLCAAKVRAAQHGDPLQPGLVLVAPGDKMHLQIAETGKTCHFVDGPPQHGHRPSVDMLFRSAAQAMGPRAVGVLLSGMGRDGASGLLDIHKNGGWTIAQDERTSIVYGMPRAAAECGAVREQLPISEISHAVLKAAKTNRQTTHDA